MLLSRFLSITSLAATLGSTGCSDDSCGPGGAPQAGILASATGVTLTYGTFTGSANNDCPDTAAPAGVISLSIEGLQADGQGRITLCIGRPDLLAKQSLTIGGNTAGVAVRVIDFSGSANNCSFDSVSAPSGTATASGMCDNGRDPAGFALSLDGSLTLTRTCGATVDTLPLTLRGRVAVGGAIAF